ncbi:MAG: hypothetical protein R3B51_08725 [Thermodesulfobacteriota bacterium]
MWRDTSLPQMKKARLRRAGIGNARSAVPAGPISENQVVFYYLLEKTVNKGAFLMLYNWKNKTVKYDRAIFFFDRNHGVLDDFAFSVENAGYEQN